MGPVFIVIFPPPWPRRLHHVHQNMHVAVSCYQTMYMGPIDPPDRGVVIEKCESASAPARMG